jgi:uncharacterized protein YoxC
MKRRKVLCQDINGKVHTVYVKISPAGELPKWVYQQWKERLEKKAKIARKKID